MDEDGLYNSQANKGQRSTEDLANRTKSPSELMCSGS